MVATHLPSNVLLVLVPLDADPVVGCPGTAGAVLHQSDDVPTKQSYIMAVVSPGERSAAAGIAGVARSICPSSSVCSRSTAGRDPAVSDSTYQPTRTYPFSCKFTSVVIAQRSIWTSG